MYFMMWMHLLPHHHHHHQQHHECGSNQWKVREKGGRAGKRKGNRACKSFLSWPSFAHFWHVWDNRVRLSKIWNVNELDISFSNFSREYFVHGQFRVVKSRQLLAKIATYLVSMSPLLCLTFYLWMAFFK